MGVSDRVPKMLAFFRQQNNHYKDIADATAVIETFNSRLAAGKGVVAWPTIGAALISKYHWAAIHCEACDLVSDMDLRVKPRIPGAPITVVLSDARCPRCNGHGRPRVVALSKLPSE